MSTSKVDDDIVYQACKLCQDFEYRGRFYGNEENNGTTVSKALGITTILAMTLLGIFIRLRFPFFAYSAASSFLSVFSGGMFVSLALFFLIPTAATQYPEGLFGSVPWIFVCCMGGFVVVLLNERIIFNTRAAEVTQQVVVEDQDEQIMVEYGKGQEKGGEFEEAPEDPPGNGWGVLLLVLAMSIQSIFEGSIVTTAHTVGSVWLATFMVSLHRLASAFSLAARLEDQRIRRRISWCLLVLFTLSTPLGAVIGWIIDAFSNGGALLPLFNAFTAGTLLYFGFSECVAEEFAERKGRWWRFLLFLLGISLVLLLTWVHNEQEMDTSADHAFMTFCKISHHRCDHRLHHNDETVTKPTLPKEALPPDDDVEEMQTEGDVATQSQGSVADAPEGDVATQSDHSAPDEELHGNFEHFMEHFKNLPEDQQQEFKDKMPAEMQAKLDDGEEDVSDATRLLSGY